jgi:hypothetical protein
MTQNDVEFERDLTDAFAPVEMPHELQQRLLRLPQVHRQHRASWLGRLLPHQWFVELIAVSSWPVFGMTTSATAACCSLLIGLALGFGGLLPQTQVVQTTKVAVSDTATGGTDNSDAVSLVYAAADMPGELP